VEIFVLDVQKSLLLLMKKLLINKTETETTKCICMIVVTNLTCEFFVVTYCDTSVSVL